MIFACFDVYYYETYAKACCIVFDDEENVLSRYSILIRGVKDYEPGNFYKRELPCILEVLKKVEEKIDVIITDSFVWLDGGRKGLGAQLYEELKDEIPVIGAAKTFFKGVVNYKEVLRGESKKPLYISSVGIELSYAADFIRNMKGKYRIPDILKAVDRLSRE